MSVRPRRDDGGSTGERKSADLAPRSGMGGVCGVMKRGGALVVVMNAGETLVMVMTAIIPSTLMTAGTPVYEK